LTSGVADSKHSPPAWRSWLKGVYRPLVAEPTTIIRSADSQIPSTPEKMTMLGVVWNHFKETPHAFESFAARIFQMHDSRVVIDSITRASVDGGRDAFGRYLLGLASDPVYVEFSLEAKCYRPTTAEQSGNQVGVREVSRLISRIRHRQFGILVTTSSIGRQAYEEVREDRHPIVFICGSDIVDILVASGINSAQLVQEFLQREFAVVSMVGPSDA
jgi:hypothetical protein